MQPMHRTLPRPRSTSPSRGSRGSFAKINETRGTRSRRIQGLPPEFSPLPAKAKQSTKRMMNSQLAQTEAAPPVVYPPVAQRTTTTFHGEVHKDVEDWLQHYERVVVVQNYL